MFILYFTLVFLGSFILYGYFACKKAKENQFIIDKAFSKIKHFEFK